MGLLAFRSMDTLLLSIGCIFYQFLIPVTTLTLSGLPTTPPPILTTGTPANDSTAACSVFVGYETEYFWVFVGSPFRPGLLPTNAAGTRVATVVVTTGTTVKSGTTIHQTTKTILSFPSVFTAGAVSYEKGAGVLSSEYIKSFFPTVVSLDQTARPTTPTTDPRGISFTLGSNLTKIHSNAFFASEYPDLKALKTCQPIQTLKESLAQPPTFVLPTTLIGPFEPGSTASSDSLATPHITTTILAKGISSTPLESPTTSTLRHKAQQSSGSRSTRSISVPETAASAAVSSFRVKQTSTPRSQPSPELTDGPIQSNGVDPSASKGFDDPTTGQALPSASIKSGTVLVDGHTVHMDSTLTLGSGSIITRVALTTNKLGQTVLLEDVITTSSRAIIQASHGVSTTASNPTAVTPSSTAVIVPLSITKSNTADLLKSEGWMWFVLCSLLMAA